MGLKTLIGYVLSGLAVLLIAGGTVGYTVEGQIDDVPTPNIEGYVFFSDEALPGNPASLFITADTTVKWDRDDIFMVIADEKKKSQCDGIRAQMAELSFNQHPTAKPVNTVILGMRQQLLTGTMD